MVWLKNARATLVNSHRLIFTGLQLTFGNYLADAHEAFARLQRAASALEGAQTPVEVNAFSLDPYAGSALRKTTSVPLSTFTVQTVEGLPESMPLLVSRQFWRRASPNPSLFALKTSSV